MKSLEAYKADLEAKTVTELKKMVKASPATEEYFDAAKLAKFRKRHYVAALVFAQCMKDTHSSKYFDKCIH